MPSYGYRQNYSDLFFTPTYNQPVAPIDLKELATSYDALQQRHDTAVTTLSAYKTALSELDLNPAESEFINNLATGLDRTLVDNANYNNLGFGLNALIKQYGDIMSNQGLRGRLDAQKNYKAYLSNLEANKTLDEDTKAYYREKNQYYYNPEFDNQGREIKGKEWQPIERETDTVDTAQLMIRAMQMAAKDSGESDTVYFKDANGQWTTNIDASADGMPYYKTHGTYEKLTKEKLKAAYETVIANTPGAMASLEQDYKVQNWKYDKNGDIGVGPTTDEKGVKLNFKQYLDKRFDGFYQSATYTKYTNTFTPLTGLSLEAKLAQQAAKANGNGDFANMIANMTNVTPGSYYVKREQALQGAYGQRSASLERLSSFAENNGLKFDLSDVDGSFNKISNAYKANGKAIPDDLYDAYTKYKESVNKISQIFPVGLSDDYNQRLDFVSSLAVGADLSNLKAADGSQNKFVQEYVGFINRLYRNSDEYVIPGMSTNSINSFIKDHPNYQSEYGLVLKHNAGYATLVLPKNQAQNLYKISEELGKYSKYVNASVPTNVGSSITGYTQYSNRDSLAGIREFYESVNKPIAGISEEQTLIPTNNISIGDIAETWAINAVNSGKFSDIDKARESIQKTLWGSLTSGINNSYGARVNLGYGVDNNPMNYATTGDQREAMLRLMQLAITSDKGNVGINVDQNTFNTTGTITFSDKMLKDEHFKSLMKAAGIDEKATSVRFIADNLFNNQVKNQMLKDPNYGSKLQFFEDKSAGVREFTSPIGTTIQTDGENYLYDDGYGQYTVSEQQAVNAYTANQMFHDLVKLYGNILVSSNSKQLPQQYAIGFANTVLDITKRLSPQDSSATSYNELSSVGKIQYQKIANALDAEVDKYYLINE